MEIIIYSIIVIISSASGFLFSKIGLKTKSEAIIREAELKGESIKEKKISQAKQKFFELREKQKSERKDLDSHLRSRENKISHTEKNLNKQIERNQNNLLVLLKHKNMCPYQKI